MPADETVQLVPVDAQALRGPDDRALRLIQGALGFRGIGQAGAALGFIGERRRWREPHGRVSRGAALGLPRPLQDIVGQGGKLRAIAARHRFFQQKAKLRDVGEIRTADQLLDEARVDVGLTVLQIGRQRRTACGPQGAGRRPA